MDVKQKIRYISEKSLKDTQLRFIKHDNHVNDGQASHIRSFKQVEWFSQNSSSSLP